MIACIKAYSAALFFQIIPVCLAFAFCSLKIIYGKMAAPNGGFFIQDKLYKTAPHHESFKQLWETKWKKPVSISAIVDAKMPKLIGYYNSAPRVFIPSCSAPSRISNR